jgi:hypothetical protein
MHNDPKPDSHHVLIADDIASLHIIVIDNLKWWSSWSRCSCSNGAVSDHKLIGPPQVPEREHYQMHQPREREQGDHQEAAEHVQLDHPGQRRDVLGLGI